MAKFVVGKGVVHEEAVSVNEEVKVVKAIKVKVGNKKVEYNENKIIELLETIKKLEESPTEETSENGSEESPTEETSENGSTTG